MMADNHTILLAITLVPTLHFPNLLYHVKAHATAVIDAACLRDAGGRSSCPLQVNQRLNPHAYCLQVQATSSTRACFFFAIVHAASSKNKNHLLLIADDDFLEND
jgi:hypothetical protein